MSELAKALASARAVMRGTVYKGGANQHQKYAYVGHEHVLTSGAREAMHEHGLSLVQTGVDFVGEVPAGKASALLWRGAFKLIHTSGESLDLSYMATTQPNDKAAFVASTALDRTAFLRVLALAGSSDEDPEHDEHDTRARYDREPPTTQANAAQQAARAAENATAHERARAAAAAALKVLVEKLRDPNNNSRALVDPLREEASRLKPSLLQAQLDQLVYEMRGAFERVREAEAAEAALRAQEEATA